jgi:hypothetical protein
LLAGVGRTQQGSDEKRIDPEKRAAVVVVRKAVGDPPTPAEARIEALGNTRRSADDDTDCLNRW